MSQCAFFVYDWSKLDRIIVVDRLLFCLSRSILTFWLSRRCQVFASLSRHLLTRCCFVDFHNSDRVHLMDGSVHALRRLTSKTWVKHGTMIAVASRTNYPDVSLLGFYYFLYCFIHIHLPYTYNNSGQMNVSN